MPVSLVLEIRQSQNLHYWTILVVIVTDHLRSQHENAYRSHRSISVLQNLHILCYLCLTLVLVYMAHLYTTPASDATAGDNVHSQVLLRSFYMEKN